MARRTGTTKGSDAAAGLPYVIDNQTARLGDVLAELLMRHAGRSLDVASAYFSISGYSVLRAGLAGLASFRLLLGAEPHAGDDVGLRPDARMLARKYYDLHERRVIDNRYVIASLIQCERDTPRVVGGYDVFAIQEEIVQDILRGYEAQQAVEVTPRTVDPVQQTVATTIEEYLNHPDVPRRWALDALRFLAQPMASVALKTLRGAYRAFEKDGHVEALLTCIESLAAEFARGPTPAGLARHVLRREDLRPICFDHLCS